MPATAMSGCGLAAERSGMGLLNGEGALPLNPSRAFLCVPSQSNVQPEEPNEGGDSTKS